VLMRMRLLAVPALAAAVAFVVETAPRIRW